jgi:hypothetical protein
MNFLKGMRNNTSRTTDSVKLENQLVDLDRLPEAQFKVDTAPRKAFDMCVFASRQETTHNVGCHTLLHH